jgi:hypothetical protein
MCCQGGRDRGCRGGTLRISFIQDRGNLGDERIMVRLVDSRKSPSSILQTSNEAQGKHEN